MLESRRLSVGYLSAVTTVTILLALSGVETTWGQSPSAPPSPIEVRSVELEQSEVGTDVVIGVNESVEWVGEAEPDGSLVVFLSRSVPGPGALDIEPDEGLVARLEVGFAVPNGIPTTRIVIRPRSAFSYDVVRERGRLRVRLAREDGNESVSPAQVERSTGRETPGAGEVQGSSPPALAPGQTERSSSSAPPEEELRSARRQLEQAQAVERDLQDRLDAVAREAETYRQRVAELHADRLQLIDDLRRAQEETAGAVDHGEAARLADVEQQLGRSRAELEAARARIGALESARDEVRAENSRLQEALGTLEQTRARVGELSAQLAKVTSERGRLATQLASASQGAEEEQETLARNARQAQQQATALQAERDALSERLDLADNELTAARQAVSRLEGELADALVAGAAGAGDARAEAASWQRQVAALERRLASVAAELEASRSRERSLQDELASAQAASIPAGAPGEVEALRQQLSTSRQRESELRGWLARAPETLGVTSMQVTPQADPCLKFRPTPSLEGPALDCLEPGTSIEVLSMRDEWLRVRLEDRREGWVGQSYVEAPERRQADEAIAARRDAELAIERLESERRSLADRVERLEADRAAARSGAERQLSDRAARIEELDSMLAEANSREVVLERHIAEAGADVAELEAELRRASRESDDLRNVAEQSVVALSQAEATIESLEAERDQLDAESRAHAAELADLRAELDAARDQIATLETASKAAGDSQAELLKVRTDLVEAQAAIAALELSNARLQSVQEEWEAGEDALAEASAHLAEERGRVAELEEVVAAAEQRASDLQAALDTAISEAASLRGVAGDAEALRSRTDEQAATVAALEGEVAGLQQELAAAQKALVDTRVEAGELEAAAREDLESLRGLTGSTRVVVTSEADPCLQLRLAPSTGSEALDCVEPGTSFTLLGVGGGWVEVAGAGNRRGWVAAGYLEAETSLRLREVTAELESLRQVEEAARRTAGEVERLESDLADAQARAMAADASRTAAENEMATLSARLAELEADEERGEEVATQLSRLQAELAEANAARLVAEGTLVDLEEGRAQLAAELEEARATEATAVAERQRLGESVADLEGSVRSLSEQLARAEELEAELALQGDRNRAAVAAGEDLQEALDAAQARIEVLEREAMAHAGLPARAEEAERLLAAAEYRARGLEEELAAARAGRESLEDRLTEASAAEGSTSVQAAAGGVSEASGDGADDRQSGATEASGPGLVTAPQPPVEDRPAPEVVPQSVVAEQTSPVREPDLVNVAQSWARAWSSQDVQAYLEHYSEDFRPQYGLSRSRWEAQRRERLTAPEFIAVEISAFRVRIDSPDRAAVEFLQSYRSNTFADDVEKTLELALEDGEWKIVAEVAR